LKIGDTVVVQRAGDVIPQVVEVLPRMRLGKERDFRMPKKCPACDHVVKKQMISEGKEKGSALVCVNRQCPAKNLKIIEHLVNAFEIYTIGPKIIERFKDEGLITDAADIFTLKKEDIQGLERFGEKSADNIIQSINDHRKVSLSRFIYALGILHVGEEIAIDLASSFGTLEKLKEASFEQLDMIPYFGSAIAKSVFDYFHDSNNLKFIDKLKRVGVEIINQPITIKQTGPLVGKKIVVTGTLEKLSREEAKAWIRRAGGDWVSSVSKNTDFVVVGENPGSKAEKAKAFGIKILSEAEFLKMIK